MVVKLNIRLLQCNFDSVMTKNIGNEVKDKIRGVFVSSGGKVPNYFFV